MKPATQSILAMIFGVCLALFGNRYIVGTLREGFNWPAAMTLAGTFVVLVAVQHVLRPYKNPWTRGLLLSVAAGALVVLAFMEP